MAKNRNDQRKLVGLLVKLAHKGLDEFAAKYATNLSDGGMFIRTREPRPVGSELSFKVEIASGQRVLQGTAVVRWTRGADDPAGPPGMGLQFLTLDPASRALVDRMLGVGDPNDPFATAGALPKQPSAPTKRATGTPPGSEGPPGPVVPRVAPALRRGESAAPPPVPKLRRGETNALVLSAVAPLAPPPVAKSARLGATAAPAPLAASGPAPAPASANVAPGDAAPDRAGALNLELSATGEPSVLVSAPASASAGPEAAAALEALGDATANPSRDIDIDIDLSALVASSPAPEAGSSFQSTTWGFAIDVEAPEPAGPPPVGEQRPPEVAPTTGPVFLKNLEPGDEGGAVIGIDLGTTNSACAVLTKGRPRILISRDGYNTIPSVVAIKQDKLLLGHRARNQMVLNPTQSIVGAKRLVGRDYDSPAVQQVRQHVHYDIVRGPDGHTAVKLGPHVVSLDEVQALVLKECRDMAEQALGTPVTRAVVTCPAYYSEPQREAVRRAGAMAGLKIERVLNEPTAAALAFGMSRDLARTVLVFDLGGGTFDATVLRIEQNVFEVRATGGDVFLGGVDFDNKVVELLLERYTKWHKRPFSGDRIALSRIAEAAERAKIALSERTSHEVLLPMLEVDDAGKSRDLRTTLTRAEIDAACDELVERTLAAVRDVLLDAKLKPSQIDEIILVGGQSRMPLVREKLRQLFKKPAHASVNADEAVALGAALYSSTLDKVSSLVLIDVVPMTIGVGRPGGGFHRLIERNSALPVTKSFGLSTERDGQTELEVLVFQGEDSNVSANEFLGAITVTGLPKGPAGLVQVAITLSLDAECVLRVEAREFKTRTVIQATLATRYTTSEAAQRLGISLEQAAKANKARDEELSRRAGGFWNTLKSLFKRG